MTNPFNVRAVGPGDRPAGQTLTRVDPRMSPSARPTLRLAAACDSLNPRCERIRALRTELLVRSESDEGAEVIALLSPGIGDGRSQLAAELAIAFAQLNRPTLLVDADLRHPSQHLLFAADNRFGLSQAIEQGSPPHLQSIEGFPHLSLLTSGPTPDNALELLLNERLAALVEAWRIDFDFVILDTAPVTQYSDGLAVANLSKRVLLLSRARHTPYRDIQDILRRLAAMHTQVVGAVINHF